MRHLVASNEGQGKDGRPVRRSAFSILELMIALALLGTLLAVAWSLLGTYRRAEQRGWNTAYRMQVSRVSRVWLEDDMAHLLGNEALVAHPGGPGESGTTLTAFRGTRFGFTGWLLPSVDPLPWLDQVTSGFQPQDVAARLRDGQGASGPRLDPTTLCRVEYRLQTEGQTEEGAVLYRLERTLYVYSPWKSERAEERSAADRKLTAADLYRLDESETMPVLEGERLVAKDSIRHLVDAQFRYSDGTQWGSDWSSRFGIGLPAGVELSFNFPAGSNPFEVDEGLSAEDGALAEITEDGEITEGEESTSIVELSELSTATVTATDEDDLEPRDVRIVISPWGRAAEMGSGS